MPIAIAILLAACAPSTDVAGPSPSPAFATVTVFAAAEPTGTVAAEAPSVTPLPSSMPGSTTTQVNVRQEPQAAGRVLGTLAASETVPVIARDPAGNWYQIILDGGEGDTGWVAAQYVKVADPAAVPPADGSPMGSVREQINVRGGPGTRFDALGLLKAQDAVRLTGKDGSGAWLQIAYAAGTDGKGWVAGSFLETTHVGELPIVAESGEVLGTSTPALTAPSPSPPMAIAREDGDSLTAPAIDARFSPRGPSSVFYSSDLSLPEGDTADWISFTPYFDSVTVNLDCRSGTGLVGEIMTEGAAVAGVPTLDCNSKHVLTVKAGNDYVLHLSISTPGAEAVYVSYTVSIFALPPTKGNSAARSSNNAMRLRALVLNCTKVASVVN